MNPFVSKVTNQVWIVPVSGMCLITGFMISLAWVTKESRASRVSSLTSDQKNRVNELAVDPDKYLQMSSEVQKLMLEKTRLENAIANQSGQSKVLNESLQEIKLFAALTSVEGPGIMVTLKDLTKGSVNSSAPFTTTEDLIIHDGDVLKVVNELLASGAEAISVNGLRVSALSSYRCVGTTIMVNDVKIASPIKIRAIGDSETLLGAMSLPGGVLSQIKSTDPSMVVLEPMKYITMPAYTGSTSHKIMRVPKDAK